MKREKWTEWDNEMLRATLGILRQWENDFDKSDPKDHNYCGRPSYTSWLTCKSKVLKSPWYKRIFNII